jgi:predicted acylesterase/phospholipase RssA
MHRTPNSGIFLSSASVAPVIRALCRQSISFEALRIMAYKILSLNGGGVRSIFQAAYLNELQRQLGITNIWEHFDLIAGTSGGSIVATAIALGISPDRVVRLFEEKMPMVFPREIKEERESFFRKLASVVSMPARVTKNLYNDIAAYTFSGSIYDTSNVLKDVLGDPFGEKRLEDCKTAIAITATDLSDFSIRVFSPLTQHTDGRIKAVDAVMASTAAPVYLPAYSFSEGRKSREYVDGGMWGNSPSVAAITLAHEKADRAFSKIRLINIGTGEGSYGSTLAKHNGMSPLQQISDFRETYLINMQFASQISMAREAVERILGPANSVFLDIKLGKNPIALDDWQKANNTLPKKGERLAKNKTLLRKIKYILELE